jgi:hypothetical protein
MNYEVARINRCRQGKGFVAVAFLAKQVQDFERIVLQNLAS